MTADNKRPKIMGVVNTSPDSFSDGGLYTDSRKAVEHSIRLLADGADIIDIGGESTRPGSEPIDATQEIERVIPVIERVISQQPGTVISVDTYKADVAKSAIDAGASIINDISSLQFDENMLAVLQQYPQVKIVLMHIQGTPKDMQKNPVYKDVVSEIISFLAERITFCVNNGISENRLLIDPGIGFGKTFEHNIEILKRLSELHTLGRPVVLGASRKSFLNYIYKSEPQDRLAGSLAAAACAIINKIDILRVHDVREHKQFIDTFSTIREMSFPGIN